MRSLASMNGITTPSALAPGNHYHSLFYHSSLDVQIIANYQCTICSVGFPHSHIACRLCDIHRLDHETFIKYNIRNHFSINPSTSSSSLDQHYWDLQNLASAYLIPQPYFLPHFPPTNSPARQTFLKLHEKNCLIRTCLLFGFFLFSLTLTLKCLLILQGSAQLFDLKSYLAHLSEVRSLLAASPHGQCIFFSEHLLIRIQTVHGLMLQIEYKLLGRGWDVLCRVYAPCTTYGISCLFERCQLNE